MSILLAIFASKVGRRIAAAALAMAVVLGSLGYGRIEHHRAVAAESRTAAAIAETNAVRASAAANQAALEHEAAAATARAARSARIRSEIHAAPDSYSCSRSPAVRALLDGLRQRNAG